MPREVGMSTGVKDTVTSRSVTSFEALNDFWRVPVRAGDVVGPRRTDDLRTEQVGCAVRPAPEVPLTATTVTAGSTRSAAIAGTAPATPQSDSSPVRRCAGHRAAPRGRRATPAARMASCRRAPTVEPLPCARVDETEIRPAVHHQRLRAELLRQLRRVPVWKCEEHHVVVGQYVDLGGLEYPLSQRNRCGWWSASALPALAAAVSAPIVSRPSWYAGCPSSSRRISPPA